MKDLSSMHDRHLNRPTLDDNIEEEHTIEITTQEITQVSSQIFTFDVQLKANPLKIDRIIKILSL